MPDHDRLAQLCRRVDGRPYPAWRELRGGWRLGALALLVDHVQGDPFAAPSRVRLRLDPGLPPDTVSDAAGRVASADWLLRRFVAELDARRGRGEGRRGSGRSGELSVYRPGPEILRRTASKVDGEGVLELRLGIGLPARGRRVLGRQGWGLLVDDLSAAATRLVLEPARDGEALAALRAHVASVRLQRSLRAQLQGRGLVAFVADGSVLPRDSGVGTGPLAGAVPVRAPEGLAVSLRGPTGPIRGLGIREGVTVITGGGFHGKSTLLQALARGHLDHVPGDGRERVVCRPDCVQVRAEDGRAVAGVDISAFLGTLPGGIQTRSFCTADASGSTSQAAAIVEAVEAGSGLLLLDEDTSATNLLVRDARMRRLIPPACEPITPLSERVRQLHDRWGVSTVLVVGGVADLVGAADSVIGMMDWRVVDLGEAARAAGIPAPVSPGPLPPPGRRRVRPASLPSGRVRVRARSRRRVELGGEELDLAALGQVLDAAHAGSLGHAIRLLGEMAGDAPVGLPALLDRFEAAQATHGPELLSPWDTPVGDQLEVRRQDLAAALNRLRSLRVEPDHG